MTIIKDDINQDNLIKNNIEELKDNIDTNQNNNQNIENVNNTMTQDIDRSKEDWAEFDRFKQIQAEQKAMGIGARDAKQGNAHITEILKEKTKSHFNNHEEAERFLELIDLNKESWEVEEQSFLTYEAKERYADRMFGLFNQMSERTKEKARREHEFLEWQLNRDLGADTASNIKLLARERFVQSTGLDVDDFNALPQAKRDKMYRKIHQEHLGILKDHTAKISAEIKDPQQAAAMELLKSKGFIK